MRSDVTSPNPFLRVGKHSNRHAGAYPSHIPNVRFQSSRSHIDWNRQRLRFQTTQIIISYVFTMRICECDSDPMRFGLATQREIRQRAARTPRRGGPRSVASFIRRFDGDYHVPCAADRRAGAGPPTEHRVPHPGSSSSSWELSCWEVVRPRLFPPHSVAL